MPVRYTSDTKGPKQGVAYDTLQTIVDGKGKWWEGMDPVNLYGPVHTDKNPLLSPFANQFMWRVDDAITKYRPDVIYFDEHAGDSQVDLGVNMGLGFLAPSLTANYYNKSLQWNHGKTDVVINLKGVGGVWNSFQNSPELLPYVDRALVKSTEAHIEPEIMAYSFQTESNTQAWHYQTGQGYLDANTLVQSLMKNVSRNGSMLLNLSQRGRGDLDPELIRICKDIGAWLKTNGEAVYASRPFEVFGDDTVCYTRNQGKVYATLLTWNGDPITLKPLRSGGATLGKVSKVELLGSDAVLAFVQDDQGLTVTPSAAVQPLHVACCIEELTRKQSAPTAKQRLVAIRHIFDWLVIGQIVPTNPAASTSNFAIYKYSGTSSNGTGLPGTYPPPGKMLTVMNGDIQLVWNTTLQAWAATFETLGFSGFFAGNNDATILPLSDLLVFKGEAQGKDNLLSWEVLAGSKIKNFGIEKSNNGTDFQAIGSVAAVTGTQGYSFIDHQPAVEKSFYRLRLTEPDGRTLISNIILIQRSGGITAVSVYPNPVKNNLHINIQAQQKGMAEIRITSDDGSNLMSRTMDIVPGANLMQQSLAAWAPGLYIIHVTIPQEGKTQTFKMIKE